VEKKGPVQLNHTSECGKKKKKKKNQPHPRRREGERKRKDKGSFFFLMLVCAEGRGVSVVVHPLLSERGINCPEE